MTAYQRTESEKRFRMTKSYRLIINDDGGRGLWNWVGPLSAEQYQDAVCVQVAGKPVDALFWCGLQNPSGSARYNTKVGEVHGTRHGTRMTHASQWMALNTKSGTLHSLISQGHDPLTLVCDRCHELGVDAWLSMRFNDAHGRWGDDGGGSFKTTQLYLDRPDLRIGADHGWPVEWAERLWDYTKQPVRDNVYALLKEAYMDYDVDGVELDFMRCIYCFPRTKVDEGRECLNGFIAELRALADRAAEKKGRPQGLAVKIPSYEPACGEIGLDWRTWVDNGWVDVLTASDYHPAEQEADMGHFVERCRDSGTLVYWNLTPSAGFPNIEYRDTLYYGGVPTGPSTEHYRAMALGAYEQEVNGLYFFNFHFAFERYETHPNVAFLNELHDPDLLRGRDQTYLVSRHFPNFTHERFFECASPRPLPCTITPEAPECAFTITIGADLEGAAASQTLRSARLRLCLKELTPIDEITVSWDGEELTGEFDPPLAPGTWQQWAGIHFWVADLASQGKAPKRGKHECTVRLQQRNPDLQEGITVDCAELDVRFWHKPGMPKRDD